MKTTKPKLNLKHTMAYLGGRYYSVEDYPWDRVKEKGADALTLGVAYRYETDLTKCIFPYHGETDDLFSRDESPVGIYKKHLSHGRTKIVIVWPRNRAELEEYHLGKEKNMAVAILQGDYNLEQFTDSRLMPSDIGKDAYMPPIRQDDDFLNKIVKLAIRQKAAPLEPYGKRMAALAVDQKKSVEGNNQKNNTVRRHRDNSSMSPSKAMQDADTWQLDLVVGVRNSPGAMHRIQGIPDDGLMLIYPNSAPFDIQAMTPINVEDMVAQAIAETSEGINNVAQDDEDDGPG